MSIEQDLQTEKVIRLDLSEYTVVERGTSVQDTLQRMREERHNCAFITGDGKLLGIFTDRDVLTKVVDRPDIWSHPIEEVMTHNPKTVKANQTTGEALKMMDSLHFRNAPVLDDSGKIVGNLTHFSVIRYLSEAFPEEVLNLPPISDNFGENREGG